MTAAALPPPMSGAAASSGVSARWWWIELPVRLAAFLPRLASAFTDGQYLLRSPRLAAAAPLLALGYGVGVEWLQTSENFSFQLWVLIALCIPGLLAVQLGALSMVGYCAMDLLAGRQFSSERFGSGSDLPRPLDTWISIGVEYLLIAFGMVVIPLMVNALRVAIRERDILRTAGPVAEYFLHALAVAVGCLAWCHTIVTSVRTVYTIKDINPPVESVFTSQEQWRYVVLAVVHVTVIRWVAEHLLFSPRLIEAIDETTPRLRQAASAATHRPWLRHGLSAVAVTMLLGGIIDYWWQVLISLAVVAFSPVLANKFGKTGLGQVINSWPWWTRLAATALLCWALVWQVAERSLRPARDDFLLAFVAAMITIIIIRLALNKASGNDIDGTPRLPTTSGPTIFALVPTIVIALQIITTETALADNCSNVGDCFGTQNSMIVALGLLLVVVGVALILSPAALPLLGTGLTIGATATIPPGAIIAGTGIVTIATAQHADDLTTAISQINLPDLTTHTANDDTPISGEWEDGPKPPDPLQAEIDNIADHGWAGHVQPAMDDPDLISEFPEVQTLDDFKEVIGDTIDNATDWGYRDDGSVYWYDEVTNTVVIKNPNGEGTAYRPRPESQE